MLCKAKSVQNYAEIPSAGRSPRWSLMMRIILRRMREKAQIEIATSGTLSWRAGDARGILLVTNDVNSPP